VKEREKKKKEGMCVTWIGDAGGKKQVSQHKSPSNGDVQQSETAGSVSHNGAKRNVIKKTARKNPRQTR